MIELFRSMRAPLVFAATLLVCVTIHEIGHVLATLATGGRVKSFSVISLQPHVRVQGKFTDADNAIKAMAGSALFLSVWAGFVLVLPRGYHGLWEVRATGVFFALIEMLGWTLSCLTYPGGPKSYDSWKFLHSSGVESSAVVGVCMLLMLGIILLHCYRNCNSYTENVSILTTSRGALPKHTAEIATCSSEINSLAG